MPLNLNALAGGIGQGLQDIERQRYNEALRQLNVQRLQQEQQKFAWEQKQQQEQQMALGAIEKGLLGGEQQQSPFGQPMPPGMQPGSPGQQPPAPPLAQVPSYSGMPGGPMDGAAALAPIVRQAESRGNYNVGYGNVDLSNAPRDQYGFPQWPGKMGPQGRSRAAGAYQFQPGTYGRYASGLGIHDFSPQSQDRVFEAAYQKEGLTPWKSNPQIASLAQGLNIPAEHKEQATDAALNTAAAVMPQMVGQMTVPQVAQMLKRSNPGVPDHILAAATLKLAPLMNEYSKAQLEQAWKVYGAVEHREEVGARLAETHQAHEDLEAYRKAQLERDRGPEFDILDVPGQGPTRVRKAGPEGPIGLPGATRLGAGARAQAKPLDDAKADYLARVYQATGTLPAGFRSKDAAAQIMNKLNITDVPVGDFIANLGTAKANIGSEANLTKIADAAAGFERVAIRNFDQALTYADAAIPTDWGPWLNRWIETGNTQFGDIKTPAYVAALLTAANEYAKVMQGATGAQGATVDARREAAELFSPYLAQGQIKEVVKVAKQEMKNREEETYGMIDTVRRRLRASGSQEPTREMGQEKSKYTVGQIIEKGGKRFRVTRIDPNNPDDPEGEEMP